jgi:hypothetical protein
LRCRAPPSFGRQRLLHGAWTFKRKRAGFHLNPCS